MKFYTFSKLLTKVEEQDYILLLGVNIGQKSIMINQWGSGWIYEADDHFQSYCMMAYGFSPTPITDEEYRHLSSPAGICFPDKARLEEIRQSVFKQVYFVNQKRR